MKKARPIPRTDRAHDRLDSRPGRLQPGAARTDVELVDVGAGRSRLQPARARVKAIMSTISARNGARFFMDKPPDR